MEKIKKALRLIKERGLYPEIPIINSPHKPEVIANGKKFIMFASNNYLGMLTDERVKKAAIEGINKWGLGTGSSRMLTGNLDIHLELEKGIAGLKNKEAALTFVTGYMVNEGCIPAIANVLDISALKYSLRVLGLKRRSTDTIIFSDEYNHASIISGVRLSGAKKEVYNHNDMDSLQKKLKKYSKKKRKLIVTDGVFSMDGDIVKLPDMAELAKKYNAMIYLDDAHATGILGDHGRGTEDYFNMEGVADFVMGTFTKSFGGVGGYITGDKELIEYLKISAKSFIFTAPIAPPVVCGLVEAIKIVKKETWRREKLLENAAYLRSNLKEMGFNIMNSETQIIPILIGDEKKAIQFENELMKNGILVPIVRWPAVGKGKARLRMAAMSEHSKEQLDYLLDILEKIKNKFI